MAREFDDIVGERLSLARLETRLTQTQASEQTGIPQPTISRIEIGGTPIRLKNAWLLCNLYRCSLDGILPTPAELEEP